MAAPKKSTKGTKAKAPREPAKGSVATPTKGGKVKRSPETLQRELEAADGVKRAQTQGPLAYIFDPELGRGLSATSAPALREVMMIKVEAGAMERLSTDPETSKLPLAERQRLARAEAESVYRNVIPTTALASAIRSSIHCVWVDRSELVSRGDDDVPSVWVIPPEPPDRAVMGLYASRMLGFPTQIGQPYTVARWIDPLLSDGPAAVLETLADLIATKDMAALETNTLSWIGNRVSHYVRRALLLKELEAADWNLGAVAVALRLSGAGNVTKLIGDLGLGDELAKARAAGKARRGVKRG